MMIEMILLQLLRVMNTAQRRNSIFLHSHFMCNVMDVLAVDLWVAHHAMWIEKFLATTAIVKWCWLLLIMPRDKRRIHIFTCMHCTLCLTHNNMQTENLNHHTHCLLKSHYISTDSSGKVKRERDRSMCAKQKRKRRIKSMRVHEHNIQQL